jgi:hypothetical protein
VVAAAYLGHDVIWWRNAGGDPIVWEEYVVRGSYTNAIEVCTGDVDGDGALEILATSWARNRFKWFEPTAFVAAGELTSSVLDRGASGEDLFLDWSAIEPSGTDLRFQVRSSDNAGDLGNWSLDLVEPGEPIANPGRYFQYRARLETTDVERSPILKDVTLRGGATGVGPAPALGSATLFPARPNPFRPSTRLSFELSESSEVRITVFDVVGRQVARLADRAFPRGVHAVAWRGVDDHGALLPAGTYFARLETPAFRATERLVLLR